ELDQELSEADDCPARRSIREEQFSSGQQLSQLCIPLEQPLLISEAMDRNTVACPLMESKGQVSAEFAYFYPPGIPVVVPGERITEELLLRITEYLNRGFALQGLADYSGHTIRVVK
ncbi:MAG: decarboxylase, partial [Clostridiales bacterium]|nr:decarboxylase [Candidatus Blautia equi]